MSEERPSIADSLYPHLAGDGATTWAGEHGDVGIDQARRVQMEGFAKPDPRFTEDPSRPATAPAPSARPGPTFDAARYRAPDGAGLAPATMQEFTGLAADLKIDQPGGERLLAFGHRAVKADEERYLERLAEGLPQLERELDPDHVATARALIADERYTPAELRPWIEKWSAHPQLVRMLVNWAGAIANSRRRY
jgi:hypothetical protein